MLLRYEKRGKRREVRQKVTHRIPLRRSQHAKREGGKKRTHCLAGALAMSTSNVLAIANARTRKKGERREVFALRKGHIS